MPCNHQLTSNTPTKLLTSSAQIHHCAPARSSAVSFTDSQNRLEEVCHQGTCLFFKCGQLPIRAILVSEVPCSHLTPDQLLHVHLVSTYQIMWAKCACVWLVVPCISIRTADATDMILLSRPGYFQ